MIGMGVCEEDHVELADAAIGELREEARAGWSAVDEDRVIAVADRDRVALSDVERNHARRQRMPLRDRRDDRNGDGKRHQHRAHAALRRRRARAAPRRIR